MSKATDATRRALLSLAVLGAFAVAIVLLVAYDHTLWKEFVGGIAGGVTGVIATVYAGKSGDDAKAANRHAQQAKDNAEQAKDEAQAAKLKVDNGKA